METGALPAFRPDQIDTALDVILDARLRPAEARILHSHTCDAQTCLNGKPGLPAARRIAVYSDSGTVARALVEHLHRCGYDNAKVLEGGFEGWRDLGMPVDYVENGL